MTTRSTSLRYPEGTKSVGTARVREDKSVGRSFAERELMRLTGNAPHSTFDEVADGVGAEAIARSVAGSAAVAADIGKPEPLGKVLTLLTMPVSAQQTRWSDKDDALLIALRVSGLSIARAAAQLGRSEPSTEHRWGRIVKSGLCTNVPRAKRIVDYAENFWARVDRSAGTDACWPWLAKSKTTAGYGCARFDFGEGMALRGSHQIAFFLEHGRVPAAGLEVLHSCDNKPCCNPAHLSEGTHSRNMKEAYARGLMQPINLRGETAPGAKLTAAQVVEIRARSAAGEKLGALAKEFGMSKPGIHHAICGRTWRHL